MRKNSRLQKLLGKKISKIRKENGITQDELAYKVGISRAYMGYIEQGRSVPSLHVLEKIAKNLKSTTSNLLR